MSTIQGAQMSNANCRSASFAAPWVFLVLLFLLVFRPNAVISQQTDEAFLPYSCLSRYVDLEKWLEAAGRDFDDRGILMQDKEYHPLSIAFYGLLLFDKFQASGDSSLLVPFNAQFQYFLDSNLVDITEDRTCMGLPYRFKFKDLKAPWYSGMTQGVALSYLCRHFYINHDLRARSIARQVACFMLRSVEQGGTIGKTPEGFDWIEEYPNSEISPQVLNGFINGLIGLREYCLSFPEDDLAKVTHDNCYEALLATMGSYDRCLATAYDRKMLRFCTDGYLFYEACEMEHLQALYGEAKFLHQMQIWAWMAELKPDMEITFYRKRGYLLARSMVEESESRTYYTGLAFESGLGQIDDFELNLGGGFQHLQGNASAADWNGSKSRELVISLKKPGHYFKLNFSQDLDGLGLTVLAGKADGSLFMPEIVLRSRSIVVMDPQSIHSIVLRMPAKAKFVLKLPSIWGLDEDNLEIPRFLHRIMPGHLFLEAGQCYELSIWSAHVPELSIFYRWAESPMRCDESNWRADQVLTLENGIFCPSASGYYSFLLSFPFAMPDPKLGSLMVLPAN